jgi:hypothetical protein
MPEKKLMAEASQLPKLLTALLALNKLGQIPDCFNANETVMSG